MKKFFFILFFAVAYLSSEVRAATLPDDIPVLKINVESTPIKIIIHDSLAGALKGSPLYGDNLAGIQYGGDSFSTKWKNGQKLTFGRNSKNEIILLIPSGLEVGYVEFLKAVKAKNLGSEKVPNWCAGETIDFKVEIVKYDSRADKDKDEKEDEKEDEKQSRTNPKDKIDINYSQYFPFIAFLLSIVNLLFIFILFRRNIKKDTPPQINQRDSQKDIVELKQEVHNLRNLLAKRSLTEDDVKRIINNTIQSVKPVAPPMSKQVSTRPVPSSRPEPISKHVETVETIDTLEYSFQENKFVITGESQQIFVINRKGDDYSFTLKDARVCQEIMPMLNAYSKCISVMGNTSSANSIGSITPGVINPTGDGRTFSVASPIVINFI